MFVVGWPQLCSLPRLRKQPPPLMAEGKPSTPEPCDGSSVQKRLKAPSPLFHWAKQVTWPGMTPSEQSAHLPTERRCDYLEQWDSLPHISRTWNKWVEALFNGKDDKHKRKCWKNPNVGALIPKEHRRNSSYFLSLSEEFPEPTKSWYEKSEGHNLPMENFIHREEC